MSLTTAIGVLLLTCAQADTADKAAVNLFYEPIRTRTPRRSAKLSVYHGWTKRLVLSGIGLNLTRYSRSAWRAIRRPTPAGAAWRSASYASILIQVVSKARWRL